MPNASSLLIAAALAMSPGALRGSSAGEPSLRWKGRAFPLSELPPELPPAVAEAARPLAAWAERKGYRMELTPEADCLLVLARRGTSTESAMGLVRETLAGVDAVLPRRAGEAAAGGRDLPVKRGRLEDFEVPPLEQKAVMPPLPDQVPVLLEARNPADYSSALEALVEGCPWLEDWAAETGEHAYGLVLARPLLGAWLFDAPENEEWDPRNELVHRLVQLEVIDRAGVQPYWLATGLAWELELRVRGGIYCFPYRAGFVGIGEHAGWAPRLRTLFEERAKKPPTAAEIASLKRGRYVDDRAALAWGAARWLATEQRDALPSILADLDLARRTRGLREGPDGSWSTIEDWDWPDAMLEEILRRRAGPDVFEKLGAAFRADAQ